MSHDQRRRRIERLEQQQTAALGTGPRHITFDLMERVKQDLLTDEERAALNPYYRNQQQWPSPCVPLTPAERADPWIQELATKLRNIPAYLEAWHAERWPGHVDDLGPI